MKPQEVADVIFATALGIFGALALVHWALVSNVVA